MTTLCLGPTQRVDPAIEAYLHGARIPAAMPRAFPIWNRVSAPNGWNYSRLGHVGLQCLCVSFLICDVSDISSCYTLCMTLKERMLYHQVHPAKLATDIAAEVTSLYLFWQHELASALLIHIIPPVVASAALIGSGKNFASIQRSRLGRYLERYMTPAAQLTRLFGDIVTVFAAWLHSLLGIVIGLLIVIGAWGYGLVFPRVIPMDH